MKKKAANINTSDWQMEPQRFENARAPKSARKLICSNKEYHFRIGKRWTQVWTPDNVKYVIDANNLLGANVLSLPDQYYYYHYEITPYHIASFIKRGFTSATKRVG